jgi:hypothetical protein
MLDPAVRIACLSNGCCGCSPGGDARRATGTCARRKCVADAGAFRTARGSASGGTGRSTRLLAASRRLAARTERERHCTEGGWALPRRAECRTLSATGSCPYPGKLFPRSADMPDSLPSASTGLTRSTRSAPGERTGISGTAVRESGRGICGLCRRASHGIAMALSRLSTVARHGCQGSSHATRPACRHLHSSALCVMQSAGKLSRPGRIVNRCSENRHDTHWQVGPTVHVVT